jgi:hypothetical protein
MTPLEPFTITAFDGGGLETDKKPFLLIDKAFPVLRNAYVFRDRLIKRECLELVGRLRRVLTTPTVISFVDGVANVKTLLGLESTATFEPGSIDIGYNSNIYTDPLANGILVGDPAGTGTFNYVTGVMTTSIFVAGPFNGTVNSLNYFPGLPVMGAETREIASINFEQTVFFDTIYAYTFDGVNFNDVVGFTWTGADDNFVWSTNFRGVDSSIRLFFITKFLDTAATPMRYTTDNITYTNFSPALDGAGQLLLEALILIPYYGRLIALNTIEGVALADPANKNFFARARFSQQGDPTQADAWQVNIFGKGGFADAPTAEKIIGATLFKNTLIVRFERSTWQLRYMGEYGTPFLFERISSDFGSESTFSGILFDSGDIAVGNRALTVSTSNSVTRIDEKIPDLVFSMLNTLAGPERVHGMRDFRRELAFWNYNDAIMSSPTQYFPNTVLVYNYRNQTYAQFRDNVTVFGYLQPILGVTWDSTDVFWDDEDITWDTVSSVAEFERVVIGNQAGYIHYYGYKTPDDPQNFIASIDLTVTPIRINVPNHNLVDQEIIFITGLMFINTVPAPVTTNLNNQIYQAKYVDDNFLDLYKYDFTQGIYVADFAFTPAPAGITYIGGGQIALFPKMDIVTKDFNPYQKKGQQVKISYIDLLLEVSQSAAMTVNVFSNTYQAYAGDINVGQNTIETSQAQPFFGNNIIGASNILWHRLYKTLYGQLIRIEFTYGDALMSTLETHRQEWSLNAITIHARRAGKQIF